MPPFANLQHYQGFAHRYKINQTNNRSSDVFEKTEGPKAETLVFSLFEDRRQADATGETADPSRLSA